jgi:hypothetical protein
VSRRLCRLRLASLEADVPRVKHHLAGDQGWADASAVKPDASSPAKSTLRKILDLSIPETQRAVGLDADALCSDVGAYGPCLRVP